MSVAKKIREIARGADSKFGDFASTHEAYGVLAEEVAELLDEIRANNREGVMREAIDVAAVASRLAVAVDRGGLDFSLRSGFNDRYRSTSSRLSSIS